jgi:hypothetical protein
MRSHLNRLTIAGGGTILAALVAAVPAFAAADSQLTSTTGQVSTYFTSNIGTIVALFVGIALFIWLLGMALRSVGVRAPRKVG